MKLITSWSDISIGQYQEILTIQSDNELTKFVEAMAVVLDCDPEYLRSLPINEFNIILERMGFLQTNPGPEFKKRFHIGDIEYGIEPDLTLMSAGVFIDCEQLRRDTNANLHRLCALFWRPIIADGEVEYKIAPHTAAGFEARAELFKKNLSIDFVYGGVLFFSLVGMELSTHSLDYLIKKMLKEAEEMVMMSKTQKDLKTEQ